MNEDLRSQEIIRLARERYQSEGTIEIDDGASISEGEDNGCYVQAWLWVSFDGTLIRKQEAA